MELIEPDGTGPLPSPIGTFELVAFTRASYPREGDSGSDERFEAATNRLCSIFTSVGRYSFQACLKPGDTCEIPQDDGPNICLVFDDFGRLSIEGREHGLLLCVELFRSEMEFAREQGSAALLERLRGAGHYPYSDLDRQPVT
ncbi:MAG: suppressor of fused domain protein [Myxococcota bacterium]|nr:suppressor of fused domain protein [Myxococcota bacterium]